LIINGNGNNPSSFEWWYVLLIILGLVVVGLGVAYGYKHYKKTSESRRAPESLKEGNDENNLTKKFLDSTEKQADLESGKPSNEQLVNPE